MIGAIPLLFLCLAFEHVPIPFVAHVTAPDEIPAETFSDLPRSGKRPTPSRTAKRTHAGSLKTAVAIESHRMMLVLLESNIHCYWEHRVQRVASFLTGNLRLPRGHPTQQAAGQKAPQLP